MNGKREPTYIVNPDASMHDLMNGATEWLQYSKRLTSLLAELIDDADEVKCKEVAVALEVIETLIRGGLECATHAHTRMVWEQLNSATSIPFPDNHTSDMPT